MYDKKQGIFKSPDLTKLQAVIIDNRTIIYIEMGANPEKARIRYAERLEAKNQVLLPSKKSKES